MMITCTKCKQTKPENKFWRSSKKRNGCMSACKNCTRKQPSWQPNARRASYERTKILVTAEEQERRKRNRKYAIRKAVRPDGLIVCSKCKQLKPGIDFYNSSKSRNGKMSACKACVKLEPYFNSPAYKRAYHQKHAKRIQAKVRAYEAAARLDPVKWEHIRKGRCKAERLRRRAFTAQGRPRAPGVRIRRTLSRRISSELRGLRKAASTRILIGCTVDELKIHLANQFTEGMTWENYGLKGWHVDHRIPCAAFDLTDPAQQKECFRFQNLQPMWAIDNLKKGAKLEPHEH